MKVLLSDIVPAFEKHNKKNALSPFSLKAYKLDLQQYERFCDKQQVFFLKQHKAAAQNFLKQFTAPGTRKRKLATLKAFFSFAAENKLISTNPIEIKSIAYFVQMLQGIAFRPLQMSLW